MSDPALDIDQRCRAPLAEFHGRVPEAPVWFDRNIAQAPERSLTAVEDVGIETLVWGERGRPGLLLAHGGWANADWWPHIAPLLSKGRRVAAMSFSGNGGSQWRDRYSVAQCAREMVAVARAAGLYEAGPPIFAAHSFGSRPLLNVAADETLAFEGAAPRAAIIIDSAVSPPGAPVFEPPLRAKVVYPDLASALARFRLMPPQDCDNPFILDYIARRSLIPVKTEQGDEGWSWRFDPHLFDRLDGAARADTDAALRAARLPLAFLCGDRSAVARPDNLAYSRSIAPEGTLFASVPNAAHHLFLDQPLAFVDRLNELLDALEG